MNKSRWTKDEELKCPVCGNAFHIMHGKNNWLNKVFYKGSYKYLCSSKCKTNFIEEKELGQRKYSRYNK